MNVGESVQPGHGLTITLTSTLPFAEYSLRKMTLTSVSSYEYLPQTSTCVLSLTIMLVFHSEVFLVIYTPIILCLQSLMSQVLQSMENISVMIICRKNT